MDATNFATLYQASLGFIAVSGAIQEGRRKRLEKLGMALDEIYVLKETVALNANQSDDVDMRLGEIEPRVDEFRRNSSAVARALAVATWFGLCFPVTILYYIGLGELMVGLMFINFTLVLCFGWGPLLLLVQARMLDGETSNLFDELDDIRSLIIKSD